jgi:hypothetical protein
VVSTSPSPTSTAVAGQVTGPLFLAMNGDGVVLRAVRGACEARFAKTAQVSVGQVRSGSIDMRTVSIPELKEALGVMVYDDDTLRVTGLDDQCKTVTFDSDDLGQSWSRSGSSEATGIWHLEGDTTSVDVTGPRGATTPLECVPAQILNLPERKAVASCAAAQFYLLSPRAGARAVSVDGYTSLGAAPSMSEDRWFVFGGTAGCAAQLSGTVLSRSQTDTLACFGPGLAPLAVASSGHFVLAQAGEQLQLSDDDGQTFNALD